VSDLKIIVDIFTPFFSTSFGGIELATLNLSRALKSYCEVRIRTFDWLPREDYKKFGVNLSKGPPRMEAVEGVQVFRYPISNLPLVKSFSLQLLKDLLDIDTDILHIQGFCRLFNMCLIRRVATGSTLVLTTHSLHEGIKKINKTPFSRFLIPVINNLILKGMDHIIALTNIDKGKLSALGYPRERITVIPNGIDERKFLHREHFVEKRKGFKILCVSRFARNKGYEILIQALKLIKEKFDFYAYFVGSVADANYFSYIRHLVIREKLEENVTFGISINDAQLTDCYLSSDIFVLPSRMETLPLVILEAMYAGLPIISTRVGGISEIVENDVNGFLIEAGNPVQLSEKLINLMKDSDKRKEMSVANKRKAGNYTWDKIAAKTFELYNKLIETHKR
jgi:glycosyltransferase involved in cell wall biosynthesis